MFYLAVIPLLLLPLIWTQLPDSVAFLVRPGKKAEARKLLAAPDAIYPQFATHWQALAR